MGFLDNYEASRERLERWLKTYPLGRIETSIVEFSAEKGYVLVEAKAFRHEDDTRPAAVDFAYGYQGAYQQNMKRWFVEDTVTSAIMRVQQLVMGGAERSTKEIMEAAGVPTLASGVKEIAKQLGGELVAEAPQCRHGHRVFRSGNSAKTGKDWANYSCVGRKPDQCDPVWLVLTSDGTWKPQA